MSSAITLGGQTRINQLQGSEQPLVIDQMVLALIPDLDYTQPVDRAQQMPDTAHIVHTYQIPSGFKGYINPDQVVYSMILGSDLGGFSFNWIGTVESASGTVVSVTTTPETRKRKTDVATNTTGNNITRNVILQYRDAKQINDINVPAQTWQIDFTARLDAIDERERQSNRDLYGRAVFWGDAGKIVKDGLYKAKPGIIYIEGIRINMPVEQPVVYGTPPVDLWMDVWRQKSGNDVMTGFNFIEGENLVDYTGGNGVQHYVERVATINANETITDHRHSKSIETDLISWLSGINTTTIINSDHTAQKGQTLFVDTSGGVVPVTVPESPNINDRVDFADYAKTWDQNKLMVKRAPSGEKIQGLKEDMDVDMKGLAFGLVYSGDTKGWVIV
jgi:hypothetical protein